MFTIYIINFLLAISTTIGMTLIPILITDSLGLSFLILGLIEGSTEFLSNLFRLLNGILFDKIKNKKLIFIISTALALVSKAVLLIFNPWAVMCSKTLERMANGTFASPRDAFVAANAKNKGAALALLNVSKAFGCILGPLIVSLSTFFIGSLRENLYYFILLCCSLSFISFILSYSLNVKKIEDTPFSLGEISNITKKIAPILVLGVLFFMGRFNDGLLMMYLKNQGYPEWFYLSCIAIFNSIMLLSSPIIGQLIDKQYLNLTLFIAIGSLAIFNITFYQLGTDSWPFAILGLLAWGIQRSSGQIVFSTLVFRSVERSNYGTAIGVFYIFTGLATMISSFISGYLATENFKTIFIFSGIFALAALSLAGALKKGIIFGTQSQDSKGLVTAG